MTERSKPFPLKTRIAGFLLALIMRFIFFTSRKRYHNLATIKQHIASDQPCILVSWHNRNILGAFGYLAHRRRDKSFSPLASASRDGSLAAAAMQNLGVQCIRGSSSRGGSAALRQILRVAKQGNDIGITPDGPRGPCYKVQPGVITTARLTGAPIIAMSYQARRRKVLNSWDRMIVPWPFNDLHYAYSDPIRVPRDADEAQMEQIRQRVEAEMMRMVAMVNNACGIGDG